MWMISPIFLFSFSETLIMNKLDIFCLSSLFISPLFLPYFSHSWNKEKIGSEKKERRADYIWLCQSFGFFYVTQMVKKTPAMQETLVQSLGWEDPLEEGLATHPSLLGLPLWLRCKESAHSAGDLSLIPGLGRSPEERNGYPPTQWT